jgi:hypothetical protein
MQALPLMLLVVGRWPAPAATWAVRATGAAYGALTLLLVVQASQARPVLRPGTLLGAALLLLLVAWIASLAYLRTRATTGTGGPTRSGGRVASRADA